MKLRLEIELGNAAMLSREQVRHATTPQDDGRATIDATSGRRL